VNDNRGFSQTGQGRRAFLRATGLVSATALAGTVLARQAPAMPVAQPGMKAVSPAVQMTAIDVASLPRVRQQMVAPPFLPEHEQVASTGPKIVEVLLTIEEKKMVIDDEGTEVWALTYNGSVPGPMIVVHEGDYVEVTLRNLPTNAMEHNVDFHAATGALGGGALTKVQPGEEMVLRWKATKPGVFVYHCAPGDVMIPYHVVHGMNGAVMVLPRDGLKDPAGNPFVYDRAYFIGEQDYYIPRDENGEFIKYEAAGDNFNDALEVMRKLTPTHVVFNGAKGALTGDSALKANVGETVLFIHAQANRDTRPHLIGGHGDMVWEGGSFNDRPDTNLETWFIRGGSAGAMVYKFQQPGVYAYVNHNLIEAVMLGATAHVVVDGEWNDDIMMQVSKPVPFSS
jgi:nitrite reductase (NO-forming)